MRALITGATGTVGTALREHLSAGGHTALQWNRDKFPEVDEEAALGCMEEHGPDVLFHLAVPSTPSGLRDAGKLINVDWSGQLARLCAHRGVTFVFTSTVMVFTEHTPGPIAPDAQPDAPDGYGYEKRMAEQAVRQANPDAVIVRLGWQIGDQPGGNQMLTHFEEKMATDQLVSASRKWLPSCAFLADTAAALERLAGMPPGRYHLESNRKWNFYQIATALSELHGGKWRIEPSDDFEFDQRMTDPRIEMPSLAERLPALA